MSTMQGMVREAQEIKALRKLLGRTHHVPPPDLSMRCGTHSTLGLRRLDDGLSDLNSIATLRNRRAAEDAAAAAETHRPEWNATEYRYVPASLKGLTPTTPEPWLGDAAKYERSITQEGPKRSTIDARFITVAAELARNPPKHVSTIEAAMRAYRREQGTEGILSPPSAPSARAFRAATPPSSQRSAPPSSVRRRSPAEHAATDRGIRAKGKSPSPSRSKLALKSKETSPTSVIS